MITGRQARVALLCAGEIGYRCLQRLIRLDQATLRAVFSYRVEPPQGEYLDQTRELCERAGVPFYETANVGHGQFENLWEALELDYIFAIKWRTMIPRHVIEAAREGLIIFHASLLPKYRGFAPINWPLINDEKKTGVTMFYAAEEVDSGDIIDQRERLISDEDDAATLDSWLNTAVEQMLEENLPRLVEGTASRREQDHTQATYAIWRSPEDGHIDWNQPTRAIFNLIRGLTSPYPGAYTMLDGRKLTIWSAEVEKEPRRYVGNIPGKVESIVAGVGVNVLTGDGILCIKRVQLEGGEPQNASEIIGRLKTRLL
ncbi:MAG TPA: methionyl-tRNA formyltransferase [Pyrinomonadaceae bacterium]